MTPSNTPTGINDALEIANEEAMHGRGGWITVVVSGVALVGSFFSMWQTTLKQPQINFYVSENIQYTRDPYGPFEVLAVPITIANGGARDGAVLSMQLMVKNMGTGRMEKFKSAYTVDAQYFGGRDDLAGRIKRPKISFCATVCCGTERVHRDCLVLPFGRWRKKPDRSIIGYRDDAHARRFSS